MNNYEFCAGYAAANVRSDGKILDYGCGAGQIVQLARAKGVDAYGCDMFYDGGDHSGEVNAGDLGKTIFRMKNGKIPFPDQSFDLVTNNMVIEHVENLDEVLAEIHRVLKPGGTMLSLFPDKTVWREGHCGIPFAHWFKKGSKLRNRYVYAARLAGLGHHKNGKPARVWADDFGQWLDEWTHYRKPAEIHGAFLEYFATLDHIEDRWLVARSAKTSIAPAPIRRLLARKLAHVVIEAKKAA
jgi:SAM-dependent methyltransferase